MKSTNAVILGSLLALAFSQPQAEAAEAHATAGAWFNRPSASGSQNWRIFSPTTLDTINWTSGANKAGATNFPQVPFGPEQKFIIVTFPGGSTGIAPHGFAGFNLTQPDGPPVVNTAITSGSGATTSVSGSFTSTLNYYANWTVTATGTGPSWASRSTGNDPFALLPSDFAGIGGNTYDLFFMAGLESGSFSPNGSIDMNVSYTTAAGTEKLLEIALDATGANVSGGTQSYLSMYRLATATEGPTLIPSLLLTPALIKTLLDSSAQMGNVSSPLYIGFFLDNIPVPTGLLGDGSVAQISVGTRVADAAVPEPSTIAILSLGLLSLVGILHRRENR